ncbi:MAG TPA: extracellular solute-binding protein [Candidatus Dormibacteraeota bacterium]|nr:extracellular solute-binding protein [Candidatus Dormibacteraeota bacterium]
MLVKYGKIILLLAVVIGLAVGYGVGYYVGVSSTHAPTTLLIDAAGTLQVPFNAIVNNVLRSQYPTLGYNYIFEGSRLAANEITQANKSFDIYASADYRIIPEQLIPSHASWYIVFASNAMTVMYTNHSKYANEITPDNWYQVITRPGVIVGVSNKDTDPSGSQALMMIQLAGLLYYQNSSYLYDQLYVTKAANQELIIVPTETTLDAQLETGSVDYVLTYSSEAISHKLQYLNLDPKVNLSNLTLSDWYSQVSVTISGKVTKGAPILYDLTIPTNSPDPDMAASFIKAIFSSDGQTILHSSGLQPLNPVYIYDESAVPTDIIQAITQAGIGIQPAT